MESAKTLDLFLTDLRNCYEMDKRLFIAKNYNRQKKFTVISTPHPIGPQSPKAALLLEIINQIMEAKIDFDLRKIEESTTNSKGAAVEITTKKPYKLSFCVSPTNFESNQYFSKERVNSWQYWLVKILGKKAINEITAVKSALDKAFEKNKTDFDLIINTLADLIIALAIPDKIISRKEQSHFQNLKIEILASCLPQNVVIQSWDGADTDGDTENDLSKLIDIDERKLY